MPTTSAIAVTVRETGTILHATYTAIATGRRMSRALPRIAIPATTPVSAASEKERRSYAASAQSASTASTSPSSTSRFRWTSCQTTYGWSVAMSAATSPTPVERSRDPISKTTSAVATATTTCAIPTASHERPNGK